MTYRGIRVRSWPNFLVRLIPLLKHLGMAVYPNIILPPYAWKLFQAGTLTWQVVALLEHEAAHIRRQKEDGFVLHWIRYWLSPSFRLQEELFATRVEWQYRIAAHVAPIPEDVTRRARFWSSYVYGWMISKAQAEEVLTSLRTQLLFPQTPA